MKKKVYVRSADGRFHFSWETEPHDEWQPIPGQDFALVQALTGAGWYTVVSCRPMFSGSIAHNQIALGLEGQATLIYLDHMEVYLEPRQEQKCRSCGTVASIKSSYCSVCGHPLPSARPQQTAPRADPGNMP